MQLVELIEAVAALLWPIVTAVVVFALLPLVRRIFKDSHSVEIEVAGNRVTMQRVSEEIQKLITDLQDRVNQLENAANSSPERESVPSLPRKVLWVDDRPDANVFERARVEEAGYNVIQADSTPLALQTLSSDGPVAVIVSDMGRAEGGTYNPRAGLDLVRHLRNQGDQTRVVFYSSSSSLAATQKDLSAIANVAYTSSPTKLAHLLDLQ
ncbi:hypothetical protein [Micromonospora sp. NPDC051141]|uniref:hypothetical protein n=1 Tax=Micromonospora sp. NPDC051141 TaxID=3364284 RepID=UPI0037BAFAF5